MIDIILGGQYGSEGKGSVTSFYAAAHKYDMVIRTGSPNAGHTFKKKDDSLVKMRQLPVSWYYAKDTPMCIPAGAVINEDVLLSELKMIRDDGFSAPIYVSPEAVVIQADAEDREKGIGTGTTGEGVGATRADKCLRKATLVRDDPDFLVSGLAKYLCGYVLRYNDVVAVLSDPRSRILIEGTQGFALSMDAGFYPFCTSTNLTPYRVLDDAGIPFGTHKINVVSVMRIFPIRIAGNSGPLYNETSWPELRKKYGDHIPDEQTTVTKKTRRVGLWDMELARRSVVALNPTKIVLTFVDYVFPNILDTGVTSEIDQWLGNMEDGIGRQFTELGIGIGEFLNRSGNMIMSANHPSSLRARTDGDTTVTDSDGTD